MAVATKKDRWVKRWQVPSESDPDKTYTVAVDANGNYGCSCPVWKFRRLQCKHIDFVLSGGGDTVDEKVLANKAGIQLQSLADRMEKKAEERLNQHRLTNTRRRAHMAEGIQKDARRNITLARTIRNIGIALEADGLAYLKTIRHKTQIELLESILQTAVYHNDKSGNYDDYGNPIRREPTEADIETVEYPAPKVDNNEWWNEELKDQAKTLKRLGIITLADLRGAMREYFTLRASDLRENPIVKAERDLIGCKIPGYFPTPPPLADDLVMKADLELGLTILEPSAGKGNIADAIRRREPDAELHTIELVKQLRDVLELKGYKVIDYNFLEHTDTYDRIIMNPPFENYQDIDHVKHAYELLKPGGRLVSIVSAGTMTNQHRRAVEFRQWLDEHEAYTEPNPDGSFKSGERPTGVASWTIIIDK